MVIDSLRMQQERGKVSEAMKVNAIGTNFTLLGLVYQQEVETFQRV